MRISALQIPARFDSFSEQLSAIEALLERGPQTDLVLLPEACLTGYVSLRGNFDLTDFAEPLFGRTTQALNHLARRYDCLVVGPLIESDSSGKLFNSMLGVTPQGTIALHYRKHHPWFPETWATAGSEPGHVVRWRDRLLLPAICFDVHFLEEEAAASLDAAELLLFPSAWVDERDSRTPLLSSLASRHRINVLNANWGPGEPRISGQGGSLFIDSKGQVLSRVDADIGRLDVTLP